MLRTDTNWKVVSKFGLVALAAGSLSLRRARREGVQNKLELVQGRIMGQILLLG